MNQDLKDSDIVDIIRLRRTIKPEKMNGRRIPEETVTELLTVADWAPTHARTEPWRFIVFSEEKAAEFANFHADLFRIHSDPATFNELKYENIRKLGQNVSHAIVVWMKRVANHKIPEIEEISATAAAIQNILLTATARGVASFWSTGGLTHHRAFKDAFHLGEEDRVMGILYLGYSDEPLKEGTRMTPLSEKIEWRR